MVSFIVLIVQTRKSKVRKYLHSYFPALDFPCKGKKAGTKQNEDFSYRNPIQIPHIKKCIYFATRLKHLHLGVFSVRAKCFKFLQLLLTNDMRRREGGRRILKNLMDMSLYYIVQDANSIRQGTPPLQCFQISSNNIH